MDINAADFTQSGNGMALAGVVVLILSKVFNINTDITTVLTAIGGIIAVIGIIKQIITHKQLKDVAIATGAIKR